MTKASWDNGVSVSEIETESDALRFIDFWVWKTLPESLDTRDYDTALEVLEAWADWLPRGEVPTLP